ncbi:hypothetical protein ISN45_Aa05g007800 [Arabidopsis thaliana x Arabidopsis arenosa]|uniref:SDE2/SF3A3 SAP domain-containing protein n=1 Tax=Arabidopsis thaliana x Arabidopsis arenosa TaxID=1240361 RepID=A0A8T1ZIB4_9BRAS|nr:hypothetical protein ISN45_Aa05g007800 [Arabidopsis thaliana x Arabidopsis arenosa]KAG7559177.1 hypothetical protein ISN45_Aa05g007800 [Arabidopsis thaliana x Arabidopsis arenosa]KAG7559178.1 hypothetical protein ISN45_Aa05g007800 [Arabidopsis thaliana x Arabidopsis arenosa]
MWLRERSLMFKGLMKRRWMIYLLMLLMQWINLKRWRNQVETQGRNLVHVACETLITSATIKNQGNDFVVKKGRTAKETVFVDAVCCKPAEPLNFDNFNSATDMEVLGMERLKTELQSRCLKYEGTLRELAARLFLLKSTPLDKLLKKLTAKK